MQLHEKNLDTWLQPNNIRALGVCSTLKIIPIWQRNEENILVVFVFNFPKTQVSNLPILQLTIIYRYLCSEQFQIRPTTQIRFLIPAAKHQKQQHLVCVYLFFVCFVRRNTLLLNLSSQVVLHIIQVHISWHTLLVYAI